MKKSTIKNFKLATRARTVSTKPIVLKRRRWTKFPFDKNSPIFQLRDRIIATVEHIIEETAESYRYTAFSWRGINADANRTLDIYETDAQGVMVCLWQEHSDENIMLASLRLTGRTIALFSNSNNTETAKLINEWMSGEPISKIREYITARPNSFLGIYITASDDT